MMLARIYRFLAMKFRFRFLGRPGLAAFQRRRVRAVCSYAAKHSSFFSDYFRANRTWSLELHDLDRFPPIDKNLMMSRFDEYNTAGLNGAELVDFASENDRNRTYDRYFNDQYSIGLSSGTSGSVGLAVYNKREITDSIFKFMARNGMPAGLKKHNIMFALRTSVPAFAEVNRFGYKLIHFNYDIPVEQIIDGINRYELNILAGSPTFLSQLVPFAGRIRHRIDVVVSYAEILEAHVRRRLQLGFRAPVHELYAATECYLAASCRLGTLHLNEDLVYVRLKSVPARENVFSVTVTDLYRTTQPIINYSLNDLLELDPGRCPCGSKFRVVKQIIGRADDYLIVRRKSGDHAIVYADYVRRAIILTAAALSEYRVVQDAPDHVVVELQFADPGDHSDQAAAVRQAVLELFEKYGDHPPTIEVAAMHTIPLLPDRKHRRIIRTFPN